jgi:methionyl aminopeptidase
MRRLTRRAGKVVAEMHEQIRAAIRPGVTTAELDRIGRAVLQRRDATSNFLGYHGFPAVICASVNDEVVHGIPNDRILLDGDLVSIDCGAIINGWHGDAAFSAGVGTVSAETKRLIDTAEAALQAGIDQMIAGRHLGDLGAAIQRVCRKAGYGIPEDYCGHGIGRAMHEEPDVENRGTPGKGAKLVCGVVLAIEPMVLAGGLDDVVELEDGWTVVTADGSRAAHAEHTVVVTDNGPEVLTRGL